MLEPTVARVLYLSFYKHNLHWRNHQSLGMNHLIYDATSLATPLTHGLQWESRSLFNCSDDRYFVSRNSMDSLLVRGFQKSYFVQEDTI